VVDVRRRVSVDAAFATIVETFGGCDILVANAGVSSMMRAVDITGEEWDRNFDVNTRGVFFTNQVDARALAQGRLSLLLALEVAPTGRATADRHGDTL
jgi:meso-butanediol dehydrogenase / (S,S)-butanediol dehydrogenase / diacetyl reductase